MENIVSITVKILLAVILSSFIGIEREIRQKDAGLRTHILVCVGSALIVLTSLHLFDIYKDVTIVDPTRMITGIVTGIGFLCAGSIIRSGNQVSGLTTAATLWIVSGVGIAVGSGDYAGAVIVSIIVFLVLIGVRTIEIKINESIQKQ